MENIGWISVIPIVLVIVLALWLQDAILSLCCGCIVGFFILGYESVWDFGNLLQESLATKSYIWLVLMMVFYGILVSFYNYTGALDSFTDIFVKEKLSKRMVQFVSWLLGMLCFYANMSPLFVGAAMRTLSDAVRISREKFAFILDLTASPASAIYPFSGWTFYIAGIIAATGLYDNNQALDIVIKSLLLNFYPFVGFLFLLFLIFGISSDFGPMRVAEQKALDGIQSVDFNDLVSVGLKKENKLEIKSRPFLNFVLPTMLLVVLAVGMYISTGKIKVVEIEIAVTCFMILSLLLQGVKVKQLDAMIVEGIRDILPALVVISLTYPFSFILKKLGVAQFVADIVVTFVSPTFLIVGIFIVCAILSFATGTSWGTYAITIPLVLPMALKISGNEVNTFVLMCIAAINGGGLFGDHSSPISDTTILSAMGAGCDYMAHVRTQLPYAVSIAAVTVIMYLVLGYVYV